MADSVTKIVEQLRSEESRLKKDLELATAKTLAAKSELKRVRSGIAALAGKAAGASGKPSPKKRDVADVVAAVLSERGELSRADLTEEVEKRLATSGFGRNGLSLRLREVLSSDSVSVDGDLVRVTKAAQDAAKN